MIIIYSILILSNFQQAIGNNCRCECCTTDNCNPSVVGIHSLWYCSETSTCKHGNCIDWHPSQCPPQGLPGRIRSICVVNNSSILSTSFCSILTMNLILIFFSY